MKIGMVTAVYEPIINGVTRMVSLYKEHLEKRGHEVTIFTLGDPTLVEDEPGVIRSPTFWESSRGYALSMRYSRKAQERLREMDILHCHHLLMGVDMAHRYAHCPVVYTNHTRYDLYTGTYIPFPQPAADTLMRQIWPEYTDLADVVITPSESVLKVMQSFGVRRPIIVIENGIDLRPFHNPPHPLNKADLNIPQTATLLIYSGRISDEKNVDVLIEQFAIAHDLLPDLHMLVVGTGNVEAEIRQFVGSSGLADHIHFTGAIPYSEMPNYLAAADIFVSASVSEVHPLTVIEAMAAGLPIAASRSPGIIDTVEPGISGLLAADPAKGLSAAITALAVNKQLRQQFGAAARQASQLYDIHRTVEKTLTLYEQLRRTRPDLERERSHGRWYRDNRRLWPKLAQLANLIRPPGSPVEPYVAEDFKTNEELQEMFSDK